MAYPMSSDQRIAEAVEACLAADTYAFDLETSSFALILKHPLIGGSLEVMSRPTTKHCNLCDTTKPLDDFPKRKLNKTDGRAAWCKACTRTFSREHRTRPGQKEKHNKQCREAVRERRKSEAYRAADRARTRAWHCKNKGDIRYELSSRLTGTLARCQKKGLTRTITLDHLLVLWDLQEGKCAITGWSMSVNTTGLKDPYLLSLDRIDGEKGYDPGNVRLVCWMVNKAISSWGQDLFFRMCGDALAKRESE